MFGSPGGCCIPSPLPLNTDYPLQVDSDFSPNLNQANIDPRPQHNHDSGRHPVDKPPAIPDAVGAAPARDTRPDAAQEPVKSSVDVQTVDVAYKIPETTMLSHAPGWTVFRNLYMSNGTLYIVTSRPKSFPEIVMITSTGLEASATPENIQARIPTEKDMSFLTPEEARDLWGSDLDNVRARFFPSIRSVRHLTYPIDGEEQAMVCARQHFHRQRALAVPRPLLPLRR